MIALFKHGKIVWMGHSLLHGEQWCAHNGVEYDYVATLTHADFIKLCANFNAPQSSLLDEVPC